jgi:hypothetical protein
MVQRPAARPGNQRKLSVTVSGSVQRRHMVNDREAQAWRDGREHAWPLVGRWKRAIIRAERQLGRFGCWCALLDVITALSGCFAPILTMPLNIARVASLTILVPAVLRALAIRHADKPDAELVKAIAVAVGVAALYVAVRTAFVVQVCSL